MKHIIIIILICCLLFVSIFADKITGNQAGPVSDARADAAESIEPVIFGISSCLSSSVLSGIVSVGIMLLLRHSQLYSAWPVYIVPALSCLTATGLSYFINPEVPLLYTDKLDESEAILYKSAYRSAIKTKRTLFTFLGGAAGYLLTVLTVFILFLTVFSA